MAIGLVPLAVLSLLGVSWATYRATLQVLEAQAERTARGLAVSSTVPELTRAFALRSEEVALPVLQLASAGGAREAAAILPDGTVLAHTDVARAGQKVDDGALRDALQGRQAQRWMGDLVEVTIPVLVEEDAEQFLLEGRPSRLVGALRVSVSLRPARETAAAVVRRGTVMVAALVLAIAGLGLLWVKRALLPLDRLTEAAGRIERGELGLTVPARGYDEVAALARSFNAMSSVLKETTVSKASVASVLESMLDGLLVTDAGGRVRLANPAAQRLLRGDPTGRALTSVMPRLPEPGRTLELQVDSTPVLASAARLPDGGLVITLRDITTRKRAEQELARSNAELEQFAFVASHDLQEPLRKVASYCQLVQRRYAGKLDKDADEFLGYAVEGAARMKALISDLLTYSRVGRGGQSFDSVDLGQAARSAVDALQEAVRDSGGSVVIQDLPVVQGHAPSLRQLFQNLIGNALKFRKPDQPIRVAVSAEKTGADWTITVADNGIGIAPQHRDRVFEIFQRLHAKARYPGTGIGLAICRRVVETHHGRIWVESEAGGGSAFKFTIPERLDG